jgi:hypothetical protein
MRTEGCPRLQNDFRQPYELIPGIAISAVCKAIWNWSGDISLRDLATFSARIYFTPPVIASDVMAVIMYCSVIKYPSQPNVLWHATT